MAYLAPAMAELAQADRNTVKLRFFEILKGKCADFVVNDSNRAIVSNIFNWCLRDTEGELDPAKGLWFYGNIGTGKSTLMKAVLSFIEKCWLRDSGEPIKPSWENVPIFCGRYAEKGFAAFDNIPTGLDELGSEVAPTNHIGNKLNVMAYVIGDMTERPIYIPRIVTTNLSFSEIEKRYGSRAVDRIGVLFNLVEMQGSSWRNDSDKIWEIIESENAGA